MNGNNEKLKYEIEKLKAEVKILKNPLRQPTLWFTAFALAVSLLSNFLQYRQSKNEEILSKAESALAKSETKETLNIKSELAKDIERKKQELKKLDDELSAVKIDLEKGKVGANKDEKEKIDELTKTISKVQRSNKQTTLALNDSESTLKEDLLNTAQTKEREGFQALIEGNYDKAIDAFQTAESAYPTYHNVYELGRLLRGNKEAMKNSPAKKKEVLQKIVEDYSWKAPPDLLKEIKEIAEE